MRGTKLWSSYADVADIMFTLVRTGGPQSGADGISYLLMFLYITVTLGRVDLMGGMTTSTDAAPPKHGKQQSWVRRMLLWLWHAFESVMVNMKVMLGISGVVIVCLSVAAR